jgi:cytochrome b6-f complex iron-sulfur subunit
VSGTPVEGSATPAGDAPAGESGIGRRSFLGTLLAGTLLAGLAGLVGSVLAYLFVPREVRSALGSRRVRVGAAADIAPGAAKLVLVGDEPVWVVRLSTGFLGLSALCTHRGCLVGWEPRRRLFACPCHEGLFDERGNVVEGLPRRPLAPFRVSLLDGDVYVWRGEDRG